MLPLSMPVVIFQERPVELSTRLLSLQTAILGSLKARRRRGFPYGREATHPFHRSSGCSTDPQEDKGHEIDSPHMG